MRYFASQPWPFPASLMLGFHAHARRRQPVRLDGELEDARWFGLDQLRERRRALLPPPHTIARRLIEAWIQAAPLEELRHARSTVTARAGQARRGTGTPPGCVPIAWVLRMPRGCAALRRVADIRIDIEGVDGELRRNVLALLSLERYKDHDRHRAGRRAAAVQPHRR